MDFVRRISGKSPEKNYGQDVNVDNMRMLEWDIGMELLGRT